MGRDFDLRPDKVGALNFTHAQRVQLFTLEIECFSNKRL